jgi:LCP family protein required for cell wall assembly
MAIASTSQFPAGDDAAASSPSGPPARRSRFRPWMMVPVVILVLGLGVGGYYALMIRNAFSTIHTITTPAAAVSGSTLGGAASITIDTSAAKTAIAQAAAGIETPTPDVPAAAVAPGTTTPAAPIETATEQSAGAPTGALSSPVVAPSPTIAETPTPTATPSVTPSAIERVVNGDFEQGEAGWYIEPGATVQSDHVYDGGQALRVQPGGYANQLVFFIPGSTYQVTFWARMSGSGQTAYSNVVSRDANEARIDEASEPSEPVSGAKWTQHTFTYTVPANAASVAITFWNESGQDVYFDDVSVRGLVSTAKTIPGKAVKIAGQTNILLMGVDARPGESIDSGVRPDSLMVLHLDNKTGSCRVLSIPRDTRTDLPGYGLTKINHALAVGGVDYEKLVVQNLLGLKIDHFVLIDFNGFQSLVDAVGGIDVTVPDNFTATDGTVFTAGEQKMSGHQALSYARYRGGADGDFGRIRRQQQVIKAIVARASGLNIVRSLNELLPAVEQNLRTDLSAKDMASLASTYRSRCTADSVSMLTLDGGTATYQDPLLNLPLNYVILDPEEITSKVAALLEP